MSWNRTFERLKGLLLPLVMNSRPRQRPHRNAGSYRPTLERLEDRMTPTALGITFDLTATLTTDNHCGLYRGQSDGAGLTFVGRTKSASRAASGLTTGRCRRRFMARPQRTDRWASGQRESVTSASECCT